MAPEDVETCKLIQDEVALFLKGVDTFCEDDRDETDANTVSTHEGGLFLSKEVAISSDSASYWHSYESNHAYAEPQRDAYPWSHLQPRMPDTRDGLLEQLQTVIQKHDNVLPGTAFEELYKLDPAYKKTIKDAGGPKKFVEQYSNLFEWISDGVPGGSVKLVTQAPLVKDMSKSVSLLTEWLSWERSGFLPVSKVFGGIRKWFGHDFSNFKRDVEECGGLAQFVARYPSNLEWVDAGEQSEASICMPGAARALAPPPPPPPPHSQSSRISECWKIMVEVLKQNSHALLAAKIMLHVKNFDMHNFDRYHREVHDAGGVKKYVAMYPDVFEIGLSAGLGTETVYLKEKTELLSEACAKLIGELLEWHGGVLLASKLLPELMAWKPAKHSECTKEIQVAGGIKKFISQYPDRFSWTLAGGPGTEAIELVTEGAEQETAAESGDTLKKALVDIIKWHGSDGKILASRVFVELKQWWSQSYESFRAEITTAGSLKKFVAKYPDDFTWYTGEGDDMLGLNEEDPNKCIDALVELLEWNKGSLVAAKVFQEFKAWHPEKEQCFRKMVTEAGSLKKLLQKFTHRITWEQNFDEPGKAVLHMVHGADSVGEQPATRKAVARYQ